MNFGQFAKWLYRRFAVSKDTVAGVEQAAPRIYKIMSSSISREHFNPSEEAGRIIADSGLIDLTYYNLQLGNGLPDVTAAALHYLEKGAHEGLNPNAAFDTSWYIETYELTAKTNPLTDYIENSASEGRDPSDHFDRLFYLSYHEDVQAEGIEPLHHFVAFGQFEHRVTAPQMIADNKTARLSNGSSSADLEEKEGYRSINHSINADLDSQIELHAQKIFDSGLIDLSYYNLQLESDLPNQYAAAYHYIEIGATIGLNPNPAFDTQWYVGAYRLPGTKNPLLDYIDNAATQDRDPSAHFDRRFYNAYHEDVAAAGFEPLQHFVAHGQFEQRITSSFAGADILPVRYLNTLEEVLPHDGVIQFKGRFSVAPVRAYATEVMESGYRAARLEHDDVTVQDCAIGHVFPPAPYIARMSNVSILAGSRLVVFNSETILSDEIFSFKDVPDSCLRPSSIHFDRSGNLIVRMARRYPSRIDCGILAMHEYGENYFHFIVEILPRILLADEMGIDVNVPILVQSGLAKNLRVLLDAANENKRDIIELQSGQLYKLREAFFVSDTSSIQDVYARARFSGETILHLGLIRKLTNFLVDTYAAPEEPKRRRRRIYVRRGQRYRGLSNEMQIEDFLVAQGFELVGTEDLSVRTQINIFRDAEVVICPTGAAVTNILWCKPDTQIHVFMSEHIATPTEIWTQLGEAAGCHVNIVLCERSYNNDGVYSVHDDYRVDVDLVKKIVEALPIREDTL